MAFGGKLQILPASENTPDCFSGFFCSYRHLTAQDGGKRFFAAETAAGDILMDMTAVVSGQSDVGLAGPEACIYVYNQGKEDYPIVFAQLTKRDGSFLVGRKDMAFSWADLKGSTVIGGRAGGVPEMTLEYVLRQNGLVPGQDVTVDTTVQFNMMAGAFTGGNGDYVTLFEPTATQVEQASEGYILTSIGQESGEIPYTSYFASQSYIKENPDVIQHFTNAVAKGQACRTPAGRQARQTKCCGALRRPNSHSGQSGAATLPDRR